MPSRSSDSSRKRRTQASLDRHGKNDRRLIQGYPVIKNRLRYLCDFLFSGDHHELAAAIGICYRQTYHLLKSDRVRLSVAVAAQIVAKLGVSAEWLLCGTGPVFVPDAAGSSRSFNLPLSLRSSFPLFDAINATSSAPPTPVFNFRSAVQPAPDSAAVYAAAKVIYTANLHNARVGIFLGDESASFAGVDTLLPFFAKRYCNFLIASAAYALADLQRAQRVPVSLEQAAVYAANNGTGYGEAVCAGAVLEADVAREASLLTAAWDLGAPVFLSVEIGEVAAHTTGPVRGAETSAAIGAAAYVDLLAFVEQVRLLSDSPDHGGVFLVLGDRYRGARVFLRQLAVLAQADPRPRNFTLIFDGADDAELQRAVAAHNGRALFLQNLNTAGLLQLLLACDDVYAGKVI